MVRMFSMIFIVFVFGLFALPLLATGSTLHGARIASITILLFYKIV